MDAHLFPVDPDSEDKAATRFLAAYQVADGKVYNVGHRIDVYKPTTSREPAQFFAHEVNSKLSFRRDMEPVYMALYENGVVTHYKFQPNCDGTFYRPRNVTIVPNPFKGFKKEAEIIAALDNISKLILLSLQQVNTMTKMIAGVAGSMILKEMAQ